MTQPMRSQIASIFLTSCGLVLLCAPARAQYKAINPRVTDAVSQVSEERITAILKKLENFGTRNIMSADDDLIHGVGAARAWLFQQFQSLSPRLQVSYDRYRLKKIDGKNSRVPHDVDLYNIVAVLPGKGNADQRILITAHYDTIVPLSETGANASGGEETVPNPDLNTLSPGVTDDGSGVACVLELARILSQFEFEKTLVFVTFAGEEEGLLGSTLYSAKAKADRTHIEAVLNNDIIGKCGGRRRSKGKYPGTRVQRRSAGFAFTHPGPLRARDRAALRTLHDGRFDFSRGPLRPIRGPYAVCPGGIRRRPADFGIGRLLSSAHRDRYLRAHLSAVHCTGYQDQYRGGSVAGMGSENSGDIGGD
jgi:hypothetical protein